MYKNVWFSVSFESCVVVSRLIYFVKMLENGNLASHCWFIGERVHS